MSNKIDAQLMMQMKVQSARDEGSFRSKQARDFMENALGMALGVLGGILQGVLGVLGGKGGAKGKGG